MATLISDLQRPRLAPPYGDVAPEIGAVVGGSTGAVESQTHSPLYSIGVGVATGALTFLVTRLLEKWLK